MHNLAIEFEKLNIIDIQRLQSFYPRVRDREDISVLRDPVTNVIMLSSSEHMSSRYYEEKQEQAGYVVQESIVESPSLPDDLRRAEEFGSLLHGKRWLDFGCGLGGLLHAMQRRPTYRLRGWSPVKSARPLQHLKDTVSSAIWIKCPCSRSTSSRCSMSWSI